MYKPSMNIHTAILGVSLFLVTTAGTYATEPSYSEGDVDDVMDTFIESGDYDFSLPGETATPEALAPDDDVTRIDPETPPMEQDDSTQQRQAPSESRAQRSQTKSHEAASSPVIRTLFWLLTIVLALAILIPLITGARRPLAGVNKKKKSDEEQKAPDGGSTSQPIAASVEQPTPAKGTPSILERVQAMVERGEFRDAVRLLLMSSVGQLERYRLVHQAKSLTSREIVKHSRLGEDGRQALRDLVEAVELAHFANSPVTAMNVQQQVQTYERLHKLIESDSHTDASDSSRVDRGEPTDSDGLADK